MVNRNNSYEIWQIFIFEQELYIFCNKTRHLMICRSTLYILYLCFNKILSFLTLQIKQFYSSLLGYNELSKIYDIFFVLPETSSFRDQSLYVNIFKIPFNCKPLHNVNYMRSLFSVTWMNDLVDFTTMALW